MTDDFITRDCQLAVLQKVNIANTFFIYYEFIYLWQQTHKV